MESGEASRPKKSWPPCRRSKENDFTCYMDLTRHISRYYVLCKKAEQRVKNLNHLLNEWKRLEDLLEPTEPKDWDDYVPKQIIIFLRTYASYYA